MREAGAYAVARPTLALDKPPGASKTREGFRLSWHCSHDERGARNRFEEGPRPPKRRREPSLGSVRSAQAFASSEADVTRLVSPRCPREGADEGKGVERVVTSPRSTRNRSSSR